MNQRNVGSEQSASTRGAAGVAAKSHEAADQLKGAVVGQVEQARERAESAKEDVAKRIQRVAAQVKSAGETLRTDDSLAAGVADRASQSIEGLAQYISRTDAQSFVRDTEQLARRQPALFFGGAFLLGLTAGRVLKSSSFDGGRMMSRRRDEDDYYSQKERPSSFLPRTGEPGENEPRRQTGSGAPPPPDVSPEVKTPDPRAADAQSPTAKADKPGGGQARKGNAA